MQTEVCHFILGEIMLGLSLVNLLEVNCATLSKKAAGSHQPKVLHQSPDSLNTQEVTSSFRVPQTRLENASISFPYNDTNLHKTGARSNLQLWCSHILDIII